MTNQDIKKKSKREQFNIFLTKWNKSYPRFFTYLFRPRWFYAGVLTAILVAWLSTHLSLMPSTGPENHYSIAWTYVAIAIAIVSLLYPQSLSIRESLTDRAINLHERLNHTNPKLDSSLNALYESALDDIAGFRFQLFDKQLPFLVSFTIISVLRALLCLLGLGIFSMDSFNTQILEPQIYLMVYISWIIWVAITWQIYKPFQKIETLELKTRNIPDFEERVKPWLKPQGPEITDQNPTPYTDDDAEENKDKNDNSGD